MDIFLSHWFTLSFALAALVGVVVVVIGLARYRTELLEVTEVIAQAAADAARKAGEQAAAGKVREHTTPVESEQQALRTQFAELQARQQQLESGFAELRTQQQQLTELQQRLQQSQRRLEEETPESRFYQRAAQLVEKGATVEELMNECELPRNEAELLISLHRRDN